MLFLRYLFFFLLFPKNRIAELLLRIFKAFYLCPLCKILNVAHHLTTAHLQLLLHHECRKRHIFQIRAKVNHCVGCCKSEGALLHSATC